MEMRMEMVKVFSNIPPQLEELLMVFEEGSSGDYLVHYLNDPDDYILKWNPERAKHISGLNAYLLENGCEKGERVLIHVSY